mmetsp:Transcript_4118/g.16519  ORF Transcript_4118/g.16519 Transcript_4118/m.16519 type:complete len:205 (+) Transcript_4118:439-1053(+)
MLRHLQRRRGAHLLTGGAARPVSTVHIFRCARQLGDAESQRTRTEAASQGLRAERACRQGLKSTDVTYLFPSHRHLEEGIHRRPPGRRVRRRARAHHRGRGHRAASRVGDHVERREHRLKVVERGERLDRRRMGEPKRAFHARGRRSSVNAGHNQGRDGIVPRAECAHDNAAPWVRGAHQMNHRCGRHPRTAPQCGCDEGIREI